MSLRSMLTALLLLALLCERAAWACPFCAASSPTICEELAPADVVVLARLAATDARPKPKAQISTTAQRVARYEILEVLRGGTLVGEIRHIDLADASEDKPGAVRLLTGCGAPKLTWSELHRVSDRGREYLRQLLAQPPEGSERLAFLYNYLEDADEQIAQDAYNEFASAPYAEVRELRTKLDRKRLVERLNDAKTPAARRGLLYTMLGICGTPDEAGWIEEQVRRGAEAHPGYFDAVLAAYLSLQKEAGLDTIDALYLRRGETPERQPKPAESHAAIRALRFHLEEQHGVAKERILSSLRLLLDRPDFAGVIIADLARWEDWKALPRLVEIFKSTEADASGLRVQVVNYLLVCPLPEAEPALQELARLAPKDVERAKILSVYGKGNAPPVPVGPPQP